MNTFKNVLQDAKVQRKYFFPRMLDTISKDIQHKINCCLVTSKQSNTYDSNKDDFYKNISIIAEESKQNIYVKEALFYIFLPLIIKTTHYVYMRNLVRFFPRAEISDTFQQAYEIFELFVSKYNKEKASFTFYINKYFKRYLYSSIRPEINYLRQTSVRLSTNPTVIDKIYSKQSSMLNQLIARDLAKEIKNVLDIYTQNSIKRKRYTSTTVCNDIIYGTKTCQQVANELGVSYNAINEIRSNLYRIIADVVNHNENSAYAVSFTSKSGKVFEVNMRTDYYSPAVSLKNTHCTYCSGYNFVRTMPKKEDRINGFWVCAKCNTKNFFS